MKLWRIRNTIVFSYFNIFWFLSIVSLIWVIVDRVALDWTEGDLFLRRPGRSSLPYSSWDDPLTTFTGWVWMITARTLLVTLNMSFFTVMWMIPNFLEEAAPKFLDMDIRHSNLAIHKFAGIWLNGVVAVVHVLVLLLPCVEGICLKYNYDGFDFSNWWDPCVRVFSSFITKDGVNFTLDEIFRLVLMIVVFCIMMPLSRADWMLGKSYSTAMVIHSVAGLAFMVDLVRKNTHQLSWRFNLPLIILYVIDRLFATFLYRVNKFKVHKIRPCSETSFLLLGKLDNVPRTGQGCGDNYWLQHRFSKTSLCKPIFQRAHRYTAFQNWDRNTDHIWNVGFIIDCNPQNKHSWSSWLMGKKSNLSENTGQLNMGFLDSPKLKTDNGKKSTSFENSVQVKWDGSPNVESFDMVNVPSSIRSWGPYRSSFYAVDIFDTYTDLVLIAAGSGFGFILSAITLLGENHRLGDEVQPEKCKKVTVLFTARQIEVIDIFTELVSQIPGFQHCEFHIRFTGNKEPKSSTEEEKTVGYLKSVNSKNKFLGLKHLEKFEKSKLTFDSGRLSFEQLLGQCDKIETTLAGVCGSESLIKAVKEECGKVGMRLRVEEI